MLFVTNKFQLSCNVKTNCHNSDMTHVQFLHFFMERCQKIKELTDMSSVIIPIQQ
jgi:hypothetical protein